MTLTEVLRQYIAGRDIVRQTIKNPRSAIRALSAHLKRPATIEDFRPPVVNEWLAEELRRVSRRTVKNYRASIVMLWRWCFEEEITSVPPLRVRLIKAPLPPVSAYTRAEMESLLNACDALTNQFCGGRVRLPRKLIYRALVLVSWHTAFRPIDLMRLRWADVSGDGCVRIIQSKTGQPVTRWIDLDTMGALEAIQMPGVDLIFGRLTCLETWREVFKQLRKLAGLTRGTPKWIRRASGTQIAILYGEEAAGKVLGHKSGEMARKHYIDQSQMLVGQLKLPRLKRRKRKGGGA